MPDDAERIKFILAAYNSGIAHIYDAIALAKKYGKILKFGTAMSAKHFNEIQYNDDANMDISVANKLSAMSMKFRKHTTYFVKPLNKIIGVR